MNASNSFARRDWLTTVVIFVAAVAMRVPYRSALAYHWDSAQFALAVRNYNIALSEPHAPGYFLYVILGRLVNIFVGDPHSSLVWISVVFGSALAAVIYLLGVAMFDRRTGVAAALFAMTSPQVWFHSCVALTYVVDGFLVCVMVLVCWRAMQRSGTWADAVVIGVLLALIGGVRQQTVPALAALIGFTFWRFKERRLAKLLLGALVALGLGVAWFVSMVKTSGGLAIYLEIVRRHAAFNAPATLLGGGWNAFATNVSFVALACGTGLTVGAGMLIGALFYRIGWMDDERRKAWRRAHGTALLTLSVWLLPMLLFGTAIGFTKQPGYVLSYLPVFLLLTGLVTAHLRRRGAFVIATAAVCVVNVLMFISWPVAWDGMLGGVGRTGREIREHDAQLARTIQAIRTNFKPSEAVVCHAEEFYVFGLRHFQLHLPEFDNYQMATDSTLVTPSDKPMIRSRGGRLEFVSRADLAINQVRLLIVPPGWTPEIFASYFDNLSGLEVVPNSDKTLYKIFPSGSIAEGGSRL